jgi:hypothetical protein
MFLGYFMGSARVNRWCPPVSYGARGSLDWIDASMIGSFPVAFLSLCGVEMLDRHNPPE